MPCTTKTGPDPNKPCQFPFKYDSITFNQCITHGNGEDETLAWCSTKVDNFGNHVVGQGKYGFCEPKCQPKNIGKFFAVYSYGYQIKISNCCLGSFIFYVDKILRFFDPSLPLLRQFIYWDLFTCVDI